MQKESAVIVKQDGSREPFDPKKLNDSLVRAGVSEGERSRIISEIIRNLKGGETTSAVYRRAFSLLKKRERMSAARYSMKRAVLEFGPSGFPFEDFVAEIYRARGFRAVSGDLWEGKCITHEIDVVAYKEDECVAAELKFHNHLGMKSDLKVALYVHARYEDIRAAKEKRPEGAPCITQGLLITNTKFTSKAITYAQCVGLELVSWTYPSKGNLQDLIEEAGVEPLTALTSLSTAHKRHLLSRGVVLCKTISDHVDKLEELGLSRNKIADVVSESKDLCQLSK